jgi:phosphoenolpyruvate phosphomutase
MGRNARATDDFMVIARIESLILKKGMEDALTRAKEYLNTGVDGIMIHSKEKKPDEIFAFCREYNRLAGRKPLVVVPSSFNDVTEQELIEHGVNIVIYANQLLRSAYPSMLKTARLILTHQRSKEVDDLMMPIKEILELIPGGK